MTSVEKRLSENFSCVKCRGKICNVQQVVLPLAKILSIFSGQLSPKYYVVTCALCGYAEFYDARVYATQTESTTAEEKLAPETAP